MSTRLPGAKYKSVFDRGRSTKGRLLVAWRLDSPDADPRAGVVVSKKTFHEAVDRNRAKRLMREAFRLLVKEAVIAKGAEWVLIARRGIGGKKLSDVKADLTALGARLSGDAQPFARRGVPV